jgi:hypothetical protein
MTWRRFGRLPAVPCVLAYYVLVAAASLLLEGDAAIFTVLALFGVLVAYCVARPANGMGIFGLAVSPAAFAAIAETVADIPRWWVSLPMSVLALLLIAQEERDSRAA